MLLVSRQLGPLQRNFVQPGLALGARRAISRASKPRAVSETAAGSPTQRPAVRARGARLLQESGREAAAGVGDNAQEAAWRGYSDAGYLLAVLRRWLELRLRGRLSSLATTILFVLGLILIDYGVSGLLDIYLGDSVFGAVCCMIVGISMVLWMRLSGIKFLNLWAIENNSVGR